MKKAMKSLENEDGEIEADRLDYDSYKRTAGKYVEGPNANWQGVATLFRFGSEILDATEDVTGTSAIDLEVKLEDYNQRVLVDLASAFISRAGGILGLVSKG